MNNNWLGFSLLPPQEDPSLSHDHHHYQISGGTDVSGEGFDSTPASFGGLDAFRNTHSHDWSIMKENLGMNTGGGGGHMMMDGSCNTQNEEDPPPKLENFLGGGSYMFQSRPLMQVIPSEAATNTNERASTDHSSSTTGEADDNISSSNTMGGLSVMKCWLRNQQLQENKRTTAPSPSAQSLSLSINGQQGHISDTSTINGQLGKKSNTNCVGNVEAGPIEAIPRKTIETFGQRTSIYRGVTRHRWTGRYEAHLWDNSCRREGQTRKGRQVYLGGYDKEEKAARAYDLAALKYWGTTTTTNFPISTYEKEVEEMKHMTRQEYIASLRRKSSGFSRGASMYRGVTRHHQHGRWQARIGRVAGNKDLYLGTFGTQEEAAEAYDIAAIKFRGLNAVTNFDMSRYDVKSILESSTLPIGGGASKRFKDVEDASTPDSQLLGMGHGGMWPNHSSFQQQQPALQGMMHYDPTRDRQIWSKQDVDATNGLVPGHQLHLGTHDFFQTSNASGLHNLMSADSSGSASNSAMYGGGGVDVAYASNNHNNIPLAAVNNSSGGYCGDGEVSLAALGSYDNYHQHQARNMMSMYYHQSPPTAGILYEQHQNQSSTCNSGWLPAALANRSATMAVCPAPPTTFNTVWNDA